MVTSQGCLIWLCALTIASSWAGVGGAPYTNTDTPQVEKHTGPPKSGLQLKVYYNSNGGNTAPLPENHFELLEKHLRGQVGTEAIPCDSADDTACPSSLVAEHGLPLVVLFNKYEKTPQVFLRTPSAENIISWLVSLQSETPPLTGITKVDELTTLIQEHDAVIVGTFNGTWSRAYRHYETTARSYLLEIEFAVVTDSQLVRALGMEEQGVYMFHDLDGVVSYRQWYEGQTANKGKTEKVPDYSVKSLTNFVEANYLRHLRELHRHNLREFLSTPQHAAVLFINSSQSDFFAYATMSRAVTLFLDLALNNTKSHLSFYYADAQKVPSLARQLAVTQTPQFVIVETHTRRFFPSPPPASIPAPQQPEGVPEGTKDKRKRKTRHIDASAEDIAKTWSPFLSRYLAHELQGQQVPEPPHAGLEPSAGVDKEEL